MRVSIALTLSAMAGCAGESTPSGGDSGPTDTGPQVYEADWDGMQAFFADHCDSCHPAQNGIDLRTDIDAYVVPGEPDQSALWEAVQALSISTMMPQSGRLPDASIEHIEAWIQAGAVRP